MVEMVYMNCGLETEHGFVMMYVALLKSFVYFRLDFQFITFAYA